MKNNKQVSVVSLKAINFRDAEIQAKIDLIKDDSEQSKQLRSELIKADIAKFETELRVFKPNTFYNEWTDKVDEKLHYINLFESDMTRSMKIKHGTRSKDYVIVENGKGRKTILSQLVKNGFIWNEQKYVYFSSSAGQTREVKTVFVREEVLKKVENKISAGLSLEMVNAKGGCNPTKYLAYRALSTSKSTVWKGFPLRETIVLPDVELPITQICDNVKFSKSSNVTGIERGEATVNIKVTDGMGMMLPEIHRTNRIIRAPWVKGLLTPFDWTTDEWADREVLDVWGNPVVPKKAKVILFASQFKMWKYYESWGDYCNRFEQYESDVCYGNEEEKHISDSRINYQMLQNLPDITDEELIELLKPTQDVLNNISTDIDVQRRLFGLGSSHTKEHTNLQNVIDMYPSILADGWCRGKIKDLKRSFVRDALSGAIIMPNAKYTYVLPDVYGVAEYVFNGIEQPNGLLGKGEVSCKLYGHKVDLDAMRAPSLAREHVVVKNIVTTKHTKKNPATSKYFKTNAVYLNNHDLICKILNLDMDGDILYLTDNQLFVSIAKRNMIDDSGNQIVPMNYEMGVAKAEILTGESIWNSLERAFKANIGVISNDITKIWNSTEQSKERELAIKLLCVKNNFEIDSAKSGVKCKFSPKMRKVVSSALGKSADNKNGVKLPHFFKYAKDKNDDECEVIGNSVVDRIEKMLTVPRIKFDDNIVFDHTVLMTNPNRPTTLNSKIMMSYNAYAIKCQEMMLQADNWGKSDKVTYGEISRRLLEKWIVANPNSNEIELVDYLVWKLYESESNQKYLLWNCYGNIIEQNVENYLYKISA